VERVISLVGDGTRWLKVAAVAVCLGEVNGTANQQIEVDSATRGRRRKFSI
jgi:hypothetical protein